MTKELGKVDPSGNYGLGQAEADKARKWAADRKKAREAKGIPPGRHVFEAEWRVYLDARYPHGFKDGQSWEVEGIERPVFTPPPKPGRDWPKDIAKRILKASGVTDELERNESVTPTVTESAPTVTRTNAERQKRYRARQKAKAARKAKRTK